MAAVYIFACFSLFSMTGYLSIKKHCEKWMKVWQKQYIMEIAVRAVCVVHTCQIVSLGGGIEVEHLSGYSSHSLTHVCDRNPIFRERRWSHALSIVAMALAQHCDQWLIALTTGIQIHQFAQPLQYNTYEETLLWSVYKVLSTQKSLWHINFCYYWPK